MKKSILLILFCSNIISAQPSWYWQNPLPQGNNLYSLNIIDESNSVCLSPNSVLKSTDGGENWNVINTNFPGNNTKLCMFDSNNGLILKGTDTLTKTTNSGTNWFYFNRVNGVMNSFELYFSSQTTGFILSRNAQNKGSQITRTGNNGNDWNIVFADTTFELNKIYFPNSLTGYAVGSRRVTINYKLKFYKTTDGGITWDSVPNSVNLDARSLHFINSETGYIGGNNGRIYKTTNSGLNWNLLGSISQFYNVIQIQFQSDLLGYILSNEGGIYKTTDGGSNWNTVNTYSDFTNQFYFLNDSYAIAVGRGGSITKTTNAGQNWSSKISGHTNLTLLDVVFADNNTGFAVGYSGVLKTTNGGGNWNYSYFSEILELTTIAKVNSENWYIGSFFDGKVFKTTNTGNSWDTLYTNLYGINRLDFINANTGFGVCKYNYFIKTTNAGQNWIVDNSFTGGQNWALDFIDENTGYAGGDITRKTTDGGASWEVVDIEEYYSSDIQFVNSKTGYAASFEIVGGANYYDGIVLKTTNEGSNWQVYRLGHSPIWDLNFVNERIGFALNGREIFKTTNGGNNWITFNTCSENYLSTVYFSDSLTGYCVGNYGNIIKTTNGGVEPVGIQQISNETPDDIYLYQNFPNPFNPNTIIRYELPASGFVTLKVYDILGKELTTLVNEKQSQGLYSVEFSGNSLASGVYFYKLETGDFIETKRMILMK